MVAAEPDVIGTLLDGRYRVDELLAVGGMSRVYRGTDTRLDRAVAIKVMDAQLAADPSFRGRFEREARAIARIDHPGIIGVFDQGEHGGPTEPVVFLVMELVNGGTLRDVLTERGALTVPEALAVFEAVLDALASAHAEGLTHRDVKPENVLIGQGGQVKVADFGLVTAAAQARASTAGVILGTVAYLSPEQVMGTSVDARADVYAAGVLLYELLTGAPPYTGDHALSVAYRHVNEDVPPPSAVVPGLAPEIDTLVLRATRRDRDARPQDARTLLHATRGVRAALGIPTVPVPVPGYREAPTVPVAAGAAATAYAGEQATTPGLARGPRSTKALTSLYAPPDGGWTSTDAPGWPDNGADYRLIRQRRRRIVAAWISGVVLLGIVVAVLAWAVGASQWTTTPSLAGLERADAERRLSEAELVPAARELSHDTVPAGQVIETVPGPGVEVRKGSTVTLMLSTGRPRVPVIAPGLPVAEAEELIRAAGLTPRNGARVPHPSVPEGTVIGTDPPAGTQLTSGSTVTLVRSSGPPKPRFDPRELGETWANEIERQLNEVLRGIPG